MYHINVRSMGAWENGFCAGERTDVAKTHSKYSSTYLLVRPISQAC